MSWTDERIGLLKKMWKEGKSAAEIAKTLGKGVTRNAVIGKAHRMGLSGRPSPIKKPVSVKKEATAKKTASASVTTSRDASKKAPAAANAKINPALARETEELKKIERETVPPGGGVALIDLTERMCKWPIGDPREDDFTFCGRSIRQGTPYCPDHAAAAYQSSSRRNSPAAVARGKEVDVDAVEVEDVEDVADDEEDDDEEDVA